MSWDRETVPFPPSERAVNEEAHARRTGLGAPRLSLPWGQGPMCPLCPSPANSVAGPGGPESCDLSIRVTNDSETQEHTWPSPSSDPGARKPRAGRDGHRGQRGVSERRGPEDRPVLSHGWVLDVVLSTVSPGRQRRHHAPASSVSVTRLVKRMQTRTRPSAPPTCPDPRGPPHAAAVPGPGMPL